MAHMALQLARLSSRLALEERTLVNHPTGRAENVAEHSHMLALVAPAIAEAFYPQLDAGLVSRFATVHDVVEAYVGDTTTHKITEEELKLKQEREAKGLEQLLIEYSWLSNFTRLVEQYEAQEIPEARFVRIIDKWMPILVHFSDGGKTLKEYASSGELKNNISTNAKRLTAKYPEYEELIAVRAELSRLSSRHLLQTEL